jgi:hypothetical protein
MFVTNDRGPLFEPRALRRFRVAGDGGGLSKQVIGRNAILKPEFIKELSLIPG